MEQCRDVTGWFCTLFRPVVADLHKLDELQDLDPDLHQSEMPETGSTSDC
jgi:hypothetical protein